MISRSPYKPRQVCDSVYRGQRSVETSTELQGRQARSLITWLIRNRPGTPYRFCITWKTKRAPHPPQRDQGGAGAAVRRGGVAYGVGGVAYTKGLGIVAFPPASHLRMRCGPETLWAAMAMAEKFDSLEEHLEKFVENIRQLGIIVSDFQPSSQAGLNQKLWAARCFRGVCWRGLGRWRGARSASSVLSGSAFLPAGISWWRAYRTSTSAGNSFTTSACLWKCSSEWLRPRWSSVSPELPPQCQQAGSASCLRRAGRKGEGGLCAAAFAWKAWSNLAVLLQVPALLFCYDPAFIFLVSSVCDEVSLNWMLNAAKEK